jgi:hypothetical protein
MAYAPPSGAPPVWGAPPPYVPLPPPRRSRTGLIVGVVVAAVLVVVAGVGAAGVYLANQGMSLGNTSGTGSATTIATTPTPAATVIYQDALTSDNGGWSYNPGYCQFANGGYQVSDRICFAPSGVVGDASVSVQARQLHGTGDYPFGLVFRRASQGNYYSFDIDSNSDWVFGKSVNGTFSPISDWQASNAINGGLNVTNTLLVRAHGSHFDFFVNSQQVGQADDSTFTSGRVGVEAGNTIQAVFNNFKVTNP